MTNDSFHKNHLILFVCFVFITILVSNCSLRTNGNETTQVTGNNSETHSRSSDQPSNQNSYDTEMPTIEASKIQSINYCELIKDASDYDHKIVRVRAVYSNEFERSFLYDSGCIKDSPPVAPKTVPAETWAQWDTSFVSKGDSGEAILNRQIKGFGRKDVTLIGKFYSTNESGDKNAPNLFGHDNCCKFQFLIMRVESVHSIVGEPNEPTNKFDNRIKFKVDQMLEFDGFTLECLELSKSKNTFRVKEKDKTLTIFADNTIPTKFTFNGINYRLELGVADITGRIASDELIVSKTAN